MRKLKISGVITTDPFSKLAEQKRFNQELYKSRTNNNIDGTHTIESFLHSLNIPVLTEEQKLSCEGTIFPEECPLVVLTKPLETMELRSNFAKRFGLLLVNLSLNVQMPECIKKGEMSLSQKQAIITFIEKKGKDR